MSYDVKLSEYDLARIAGYLGVISYDRDQARRSGYESEHPHYNPHPVPVRYCGACMSVATLCDCHWSNCLPVGTPPPAGPYSLAVLGLVDASEPVAKGEPTPNRPPPNATNPAESGARGLPAFGVVGTSPSPNGSAPPDDPKESVGSFGPPPVVFDVWTDGSGTTALKDAGIGVVVLRNGEEICEASTWIGAGSNNEAEVRAIRRALRIIFDITHDRLHPVVVHSDSEFAIGAITSERWDIRRNPRLVDLVHVMRVEVARWPRLSFVKVRGHSGLPLNDRADALAGRARKQGLEIRARQFAAEAEKVRKLA